MELASASVIVLDSHTLSVLPEDGLYSVHPSVKSTVESNQPMTIIPTALAVLAFHSNILEPSTLTSIDKVE